MKPVVVALLSPQGDELARLPLPRYLVAAAGEAEQRPAGGSIAPSVLQIEDAIQQALLREGLEPAVSKIDFQLAVSRGLLQDTSEPQVVIRLPVQETASPGPRAGFPESAWSDAQPEGSEFPPADPDDAFSGIFDLEENAGEGEPYA